MKELKNLLILILISILIAGCTQSEKASTPTPTPTLTPTSIPTPTPQPAPEIKEIKIGVLVPKTGRFQTSGVAMENAARLAEKHISEMGLAKRYKITLEIADCGDTAEKAKSAFLELANRGVIAIVGTYSSPQSIACADSAKETGTPFIISVGSSGMIEQKVDEGNRYVFRNAYNTTYWGILAAEFLRISNAEGYYFQGFQPLSTFNQGMLKIIKERTNLPLIAETYYNPKVDPKDVQNQAKTAASATGERDVVILGDPGSLAVSYLKEYRKNNGSGIVYSVGGVLALPHVLKGLNRTADYTAFQAAALEGVRKSEFTEKYFADYRKEFGEEANNYAGVLTYDAILILAQALENVNAKGSKEIKDQLIDVLEKGEFTSASGKYRFNDKHQALWGSKELQGIIAEWINGKAVIVYPEKLAESEVAWP